MALALSWLLLACTDAPVDPGESDGGHPRSDAATSAPDGGFGVDAADPPSGRTLTITRDVGSEPMDGHDGCIAWQSVFLLNDGRIAALGTGNHAPEQSNAVRCIDPVTTPGETRSYEPTRPTRTIRSSSTTRTATDSC